MKPGRVEKTGRKTGIPWFGQEIWGMEKQPVCGMIKKKLTTKHGAARTEGGPGRRETG